MLNFVTRSLKASSQGTMLLRAKGPFKNQLDVVISLFNAYDYSGFETL